jgi:hypothetical protein
MRLNMNTKTRFFLLCMLFCLYYSLHGLCSPRSLLSQAIIAKYCSSNPLLDNLSCQENRLKAPDEKAVAFRRRFLGALRQTIGRHGTPNIKGHQTPDELVLPAFAGQFTKTLEHDPNTGLLTSTGQTSYRTLLQALNTGKQSIFNAIVRAPQAKQKLVDPQNGFTFSFEGSDSSLFTIAQPPNLSSAWAVADMVEVYLQALCRDVTFSDYGTGLNTDADGHGGSLTTSAAQVLQDLPAYKGPRTGSNMVDGSVLFRGSSAGDQVGPYLSQFLLMSTYTSFPVSSVPVVIGSTGINNLNLPPYEIKQFVPIAQKREFGVSWADFIALQNGLVPKKYTLNDFDQSKLRYIINGRDVATYVHSDSPYQEYYNVIGVLNNAGFPLSEVLPYQNGTITNEAPFGSMGVPNAYGLIGGACLEALKTAWAQKWRLYRRIRPEAMAGLIHQAKVMGTNTLNLHSSLFDLHNGIDVLSLIRERNEQQALRSIDPEQLLSPDQAATYLLGQVYPEGCPSHPSYPAAHAVIAGACVTVIKAIFEDTTPLASNGFVPVKVDPTNSMSLVPLVNEGEQSMTVGSELDKLASNIALGRDFAGVHYRSDGEEGILLGEAVAIRYLQDQACMYTEETFTGFALTKRDGTRIHIIADKNT